MSSGSMGTCSCPDLQSTVNVSLHTETGMGLSPSPAPSLALPAPATQCLILEEVYGYLEVLYLYPGYSMMNLGFFLYSQGQRSLSSLSYTLPISQMRSPE